MRITGGTLRSRRFDAPAGSGTRPTTDKVREALFSVLGHHVSFDGAVIVDAFAGSGALAFEALSRGADHAFLLEGHRGALRTIAANAKELGLESRLTVLAGDAERTMGRIGKPVRVAFFDPPYDFAPTEAFQRLLDAFCTHTPLDDGALIVVEHRAGDEIAVPTSTSVLADRTWGDTAARILQRAPQ